MWAVCFVARSRDSVPDLTARNFAETCQQGTEMITRRRAVSAALSSDPESAGERPRHESATRVPGSGIVSRLPQVKCTKLYKYFAQLGVIIPL